MNDIELKIFLEILMQIKFKSEIDFQILYNIIEYEHHKNNIVIHESDISNYITKLEKFGVIKINTNINLSFNINKNIILHTIRKYKIKKIFE